MYVPVFLWFYKDLNSYTIVGEFHMNIYFILTKSSPFLNLPTTVSSHLHVLLSYPLSSLSGLYVHGCRTIYRSMDIQGLHSIKKTDSLA